MDKTLWTTINYDALNELESPKCQNDTMVVSTCPDESINMIPAIPETSTENSTKDLLKDLPNGNSLSSSLRKKKEKRNFCISLDLYLTYLKMLSDDDLQGILFCMALFPRGWQFNAKGDNDKHIWDPETLRQTELGSLPDTVLYGLECMRDALESADPVQVSYLIDRGRYSFQIADYLAGIIMHGAPVGTEVNYRGTGGKIEKLIIEFYLKWLDISTAPRPIDNPRLYLQRLAELPEFNYCIKSIISDHWIQKMREEGWA
jgi:hypothetical protein